MWDRVLFEGRQVVRFACFLDVFLFNGCIFFNIDGRIFTGLVAYILPSKKLDVLLTLW